MSAPVESSYAGYPTLVLPDPKDPVKNAGIQLGVRKLQAVVANLDAVRAFIAKHTASAAGGKTSAAAPPPSPSPIPAPAQAAASPAPQDNDEALLRAILAKAGVTSA